MCLCFKHVRLLDSCFLGLCSAFLGCVSGVYAYMRMHALCMRTYTHEIQVGCVCMPYVCARMSLPKNPNPFLHVFLIFYSHVLASVLLVLSVLESLFLYFVLFVLYLLCLLGF